MNDILRKNRFFSFSLVIRGLEVKPSFFTFHFGVIPDRAFEYGDEFTCGKITSKRRMGVWVVSSSKIKEFDDHSHTQYILSQLKLPNPSYFFEIKEKKLEVVFSFGVNCLYSSHDKNSFQELVDYIDQKYGEVAYQYHAKIWIDPYFDDEPEDTDESGVIEGEALRKFIEGLE